MSTGGSAESARTRTWSKALTGAMKIIAVLDVRATVNSAYVTSSVARTRRQNKESTNAAVPWRRQRRRDANGPFDRVRTYRRRARQRP